MSTLYLFEKDGSGPVVCSGTVDDGPCSYWGGGFFFTNDGNRNRVYQLNGTTVTYIQQFSGGNYTGICTVREKHVGPRTYEGSFVFVLRYLSSLIS